MARLNRKPVSSTAQSVEIPTDVPKERGTMPGGIMQVLEDSDAASRFVSESAVQTRTEPEYPWLDPFLLNNPGLSRIQSFRVREVALRKLAFISEKTRYSQNKIVNTAIEKAIDELLKELGVEE